jgi:hypothetical protein
VSHNTNIESRSSHEPINISKIEFCYESRRHIRVGALNGAVHMKHSTLDLKIVHDVRSHFFRDAVNLELRHEVNLNTVHLRLRVFVGLLVVLLVRLLRVGCKHVDLDEPVRMRTGSNHEEAHALQMRRQLVDVEQLVRVQWADAGITIAVRRRIHGDLAIELRGQRQALPKVCEHHWFNLGFAVQETSMLRMLSSIGRYRIRGRDRDFIIPSILHTSSNAPQI